MSHRFDFNRQGKILYESSCGLANEALGFLSFFKPYAQFLSL